ncbi:MAG: hypothetical protein H3C51_12145 [Rubellimicrobium sp.]|nr:hypothetical protein [Rubellimicrobium sp.]
MLKYCIPEQASRNQISDVVKRYLENTPEIRHVEARDLVLFALQQAFPCVE